MWGSTILSNSYPHCCPFLVDCLVKFNKVKVESWLEEAVRSMGIEEL